jgi:KaiC/GvpD/RAD55 family RecA-like ATPase
MHERYSQLGWALTPAKGKDAYLSRWQQTKPVEPEFAAGRFADDARNIAVVLGTSGLAVTELDDESSRDEFRQLTGENPRTAIAISGSGKPHVYWKAPPGVKRRTRNGMELRAGASIVVAPPSIHPGTGQPYTWVEGREPWTVGVLELPATIVAYFDAKSANGAAPAIAGKLTKGSRTEALMILGGAMRRRGAVAVEILAAMQAMNELRCDPLLPDKKLKEMAEGLEKRYDPGDPFDAGLEAAMSVEAEAPFSSRPFSSFRPRNIVWAVPGFIPAGKLAMVAGEGGLGKSTWALSRCADLTKQGDSVVYVSFEDEAEDFLVPRALAAGADTTRLWDLSIPTPDGLVDLRLPQDLETIRAAVEHHKAKLLVLDPIVAAVDMKIDTHKDQHVRVVLARLKRLAEETRCAVLMVAHLNKGASTDAYLRVGNSVAFQNAARSVVLVVKDKWSGEDGYVLVAQSKKNLAPSVLVQRHAFEEVELPGVLDPLTGKPVSAASLTFVENALDVDADDILKGPDKVTMTDKADDFLLAELADGEWKNSQHLRALAEQRGLSESTLKRSAAALGVENERRGQGSEHVTYWRLP